MVRRISTLVAVTASALTTAAAGGTSPATFARTSDAEGEACEAMQTSLLQTGAAVAPRAHTSRNSGVKAVSADSLVSSAATAGRQPGSNEHGPYEAHSETVHVGGYEGCGWLDAQGNQAGRQDAEVWYPVATVGGEEPGRVPVISFSHGYLLGEDGIGGVGVGMSHGTIIPYLTSWGYVVILHTSEAHEYIWRHPTNPMIRRRRSVASLEAQDSSLRDQPGDSEEEEGVVEQPRRQLPPGVPSPIGPVHCTDATYDQIRSLEWIRASEFASRIDWDLPTGVAGFSQGGTATMQSLMNASAVAEHNIGAGFAWMPYEITSSDDRSPLAPLFLAAGALDELSIPEEIQEFYNAIVTDVPRAHAVVAALDHNDALRDEPFHRFAAAMFQCHLSERSDACAVIYGDAADALCNSPQLTVCEHANGPAS